MTRWRRLFARLTPWRRVRGYELMAPWISTAEDGTMCIEWTPNKWERFGVAIGPAGRSWYHVALDRGVMRSGEIES